MKLPLDREHNRFSGYGDLRGQILKSYFLYREKIQIKRKIYHYQFRSWFPGVWWLILCRDILPRRSSLIPGCWCPGTRTRTTIENQFLPTLYHAHKGRNALWFDYFYWNYNFLSIFKFRKETKDVYYRNDSVKYNLTNNAFNITVRYNVRSKNLYLFL